MSTPELESKVRELRQLQALIAEAETEAESIKGHGQDRQNRHQRPPQGPSRCGPDVHQGDHHPPLFRGMMTPLKSIRAKCLDCCCGQANEVRLCTCEDCTLYPYRFGKNPNRKGITNGGSFAKKHGSTADLALATPRVV